MDNTTGLVILGLLVFGAALFSFLLSTTILWGATKLLKFKEPGFKKSMKVVGILCLIMIVVYAMIFGLSILIPSEELLVVLLILAGIFSLVILASLIKTTFNETWTSTIIAIIIYLGLSVGISVALYFTLIIPVVMWQLGVFDAGSTPSVVTTGWSRIQPISASIGYGIDGSIQATFLNTAGTTISITEITLSESNAPSGCSGTLIEGVTASTNNPISIKPGDGFEVTSNCGRKATGDPFDTEITIKYQAVIGGVTSERTENGHIRGQAEEGLTHTSQAPSVETTITHTNPVPSTVAMGWSKIIPNSASVRYNSNDLFEATFQNRVGTTISVQSVKVDESNTPAPNRCTVVSVNDYGWTEGHMTYDIETDKQIKIIADCSAISDKDAGDPFDMEMTFLYTTVLGDVYTAHTETGRIRGSVEA